MKKLIIIFMLISSVVNAQEIVLKNNWYIKNSIEVNTKDKDVSSPDFQQQDWYKTSVPSTVLNTFVKNGVYPDPRVGMNNFLIPDVSDSFNSKHVPIRFALNQKDLILLCLRKGCLLMESSPIINT